MSTFTLFTASLALLAPLAAALDVPGGSNPTAGAVLLPDASNPVTAGKPYSITWTPKTDGCGDKLDIVLLKGPSAALMSAQSYIAQGVSTTAGKYSWDVPTTLAPSSSDYGIEVICASTQAYQYSTRFGLINAAYSSGSSSSSSSASTSASSTSAAGNSSTLATTSSSASRSSETPKYPISGNSTTPSSTAGAAAGTGSGAGSGSNGAAVTPTITRTSTQTGQATGTATSAGSTQSSGAASLAQVKIGLGSLAAVAAVAFAAL